MKLLAFLFVFQSAIGFSQSRYFMWSHHDIDVKAIHGISFGVGSFMEKQTKTNGIKFDLPGIGLLFPLVGSFEPPHGTCFANDSLILAGSNKFVGPYETSTNGLYLSLFGDIEEKINGISINPLFSSALVNNGISIDGFIGFKDVVRGVSITGFWNSNAKAMGLTVAGFHNYNIKTRGVQISLFNKSMEMKGVQIGGVMNTSYKMRGLQIGLFNKSSDTRGIQIGLFNMNEKRNFPLFNWNFD